TFSSGFRPLGRGAWVGHRPPQASTGPVVQPRRATLAAASHSERAGCAGCEAACEALLVLVRHESASLPSKFDGWRGHAPGSSSVPPVPGAAGIVPSAGAVPRLTRLVPGCLLFPRRPTVR